MNKKTGKHPGGRPLKNPKDGRRKETSVNLTNANIVWLDEQESSRSDTINSLIEKERGNET